MFKSFDMFPKIMEDQPTFKTCTGGLLSLFTISTIIILIMNEFYLTFIKGEL
jgi:hypothetical protein